MPAQPPLAIIGRTGKPVRLRGRLSSNVRRRKQAPQVLAPPSRGHGPRKQGPRFGQARERPRAVAASRSGARRFSLPAAFKPNSQVKPLRGASTALPPGCYCGARATSPGAPLRFSLNTPPCASEPLAKTPAPDRFGEGEPVPELLRLTAAGSTSRAAPPNPSLKSRPATAGRLARAAPVVHHAPHGQAVPPPRSA